MSSRAKWLVGLLGTLGVLLLLHAPLLRLPYFWDEAGYYVPAALDFYHLGRLIPVSTLPTGHTPLVPVYLTLAWRLFGFSRTATRSAMILIAAATLVATYALGRRAARREIAIWTCLLLALSPLFFAQSSLVALDLAAALFTTLAVTTLLDGRWARFACAATLALLSKETAVILLPVAWFFAWRRRRDRRLAAWGWLIAPLFPLLAWSLYYHHTTGYWTGNGGYLQYNLYSTLEPDRIGLSFLRRLYELFVGGFNWLLVTGAVAAIGWKRRRKRTNELNGKRLKPPGAGLQKDFVWLAVGLTTVYVIFHSAVGGAILPRYLLPIFPAFYLLLAMCIDHLPRPVARGIFGCTILCFVGAWFINPPYPFPYEDNLAYADFVRLHEKAARFLAAQPGQPRILTAWPATDELARPFLGYVRKPLRVVHLPGFTAQDFKNVSAESFDVLYLYSRKWDPQDNWFKRFPAYPAFIERVFDYSPAVSDEELMARYHLKLIATYRNRGQWVKIYRR